MEFKGVFARMGDSRLKAFDIGLTELSPEELHRHVITSDTNFTRAGFNIHLARRWLPFAFQYYLPCFGLVLTSWISFAVSPRAVPGRVALLITVFLVLTTFFMNALVSAVRCSIIFYLDS